jgi:esterase/lipase superfamily enzyme
LLLCFRPGLGGAAENSSHPLAGQITLAQNHGVSQGVLVSPELPPGVQLPNEEKDSQKQKNKRESRLVSVPVFYATNRLPSKNRELSYSKKRGLKLEFGRCEVIHTVNEDEERADVYFQKHNWQLKDRGTNNQVSSPRLYDSANDLLAAIKSTQEESGDNRLIVFVHGYAASFNKAVRFGARLAYGTGIPVLVFSWPTQHNPIIYTADECNAEWTFPRFQQFLTLLNQHFPSENITLVSHSMGARIVSWALQAVRTERSQHVEEERRYQHVFFCCPDIDRDTFAIYADRFRTVSNDTVVFVSSNDVRLGVSELLHGHARLGEFKEQVRSIPGVKTVDFSVLDPGFGHSMPYALIFQILNHDLLPPGIELVKKTDPRSDTSVLEVVKIAKKH